jgi:hypothetical protein
MIVNPPLFYEYLISCNFSMHDADDYAVRMLYVIVIPFLCNKSWKS